MCNFNPKNKGRRIDPCMKPLLKWLNKSGYKTIASCCGHSRYPMSIVIRRGSLHIELLSGVLLDREKKFYKTDGNSMYFIMETAYPTLTGRVIVC